MLFNTKTIECVIYFIKEHCLNDKFSLKQQLIIQVKDDHMYYLLFLVISLKQGLFS